MSATASMRLAWQVAQMSGDNPPQAALFGAHILQNTDLEAVMRPELTNLIDISRTAFADVDTSVDIMAAILSDRELPVTQHIVFMRDALEHLSHEQRVRLNGRRERLRHLGRTLVFAESSVGAPHRFDELRDVLATFRDTVDLRPSVLDDDERWDTGQYVGLERIARSLPPVVMRGSTLIRHGQVHRKARPTLHCPDCDTPLGRGAVTMRFNYAPSDSASQTVPGYICPCGRSWPDPKSVRVAYQAAFKRTGRQ